MGIFKQNSEKTGSPIDGSQSPDIEDNRRVSIVGGKRWNRICPPIGRKGQPVDTGLDSDGDTAEKLMALEADDAIKYRTCSWYKTAALLFSEYICLAIMSFPYSYSVLGLVPGIILTVVQAAFVLYTSLIVW